MLEADGRLVVQERNGRATRTFLYLSVDVVRDSKFPLTKGAVHVRIDGKSLVVTQ